MPPGLASLIWTVPTKVSTTRRHRSLRMKAATAEQPAEHSGLTYSLRRQLSGDRFWTAGLQPRSTPNSTDSPAVRVRWYWVLPERHQLLAISQMLHSRGRGTTPPWLTRSWALTLLTDRKLLPNSTATSTTAALAARRGFTTASTAAIRPGRQICWSWCCTSLATASASQVS